MNTFTAPTLNETEEEIRSPHALGADYAGETYCVHCALDRAAQWHSECHPAGAESAPSVWYDWNDTPEEGLHCAVPGCGAELAPSRVCALCSEYLDHWCDGSAHCPCCSADRCPCCADSPGELEAVTLRVEVLSGAGHLAGWVERSIFVLKWDGVSSTTWDECLETAADSIRCTVGAAGDLISLRFTVSDGWSAVVASWCGASAEDTAELIRDVTAAADRLAAPFSL